MLNHSCESIDLILVGCVKSKRHYDGPARDVYTSTLWRWRRAYAELHGCPWYVLSAKHRLLAPSTLIEPYNLSLDDFSASERREWSRRILDDLAAAVPELDGKNIEVHAGKHYVECGVEKGLREAGAVIHVTVQTGLNLMRQIDYKHGTTCECSWGFPGGID